MFRTLLCLTALAAVASADVSAGNQAVIDLIERMIKETAAEDKKEDALYDQYACDNRDVIKTASMSIILNQKIIDQADADRKANEGDEGAATTAKNTAQNEIDKQNEEIKTRTDKLAELRQNFAKVTENNKKLRAAYREVNSALSSNRRPSLMQLDSAKSYLRQVLLQAPKNIDVKAMNTALLHLEDAPAAQDPRGDVMSAVIKLVNDGSAALEKQMEDQRNTFSENVKEQDKLRIQAQAELSNQQQEHDKQEALETEFKARALDDQATIDQATSAKNAAGDQKKTAITDGTARRKAYMRDNRNREANKAMMEEALEGMKAQQSFTQIEAPKFIQTELTVATPPVDTRKNVLSLLAKKALKTKSATLTALVVAASKQTSKNAFGQVVSAINDMIQNVQKQITDMSSANSDCKKSIEDASTALNAAMSDVETYTSNMQSASNTMHEEEVKIAKQNNQIAHEKESLAKRKAHAEEMNSFFKTVITRAGDNANALNTSFFEGKTFTQNFAKEFDNGVMTITEIQKTEEGEADEGKAEVNKNMKALAHNLVDYYNKQVEYKTKKENDQTDFKAETKLLDEQSNEAITTAKDALAKAEGKKADAATEKADAATSLKASEDNLDEAHKQMDDINKSCVQGEGIAERVEGRKNQIEQLKSALAVLREG